VGTIKPVDLENYQDKREEEGRAPATIDYELTTAKTVINKAFDNDMADGRTLKAFKTVKRKLEKGTNARERTLTTAEYMKLSTGKVKVKKKDGKEKIEDVAPPRLRSFLTVAFHTGMRRGELLNLKWSHIDKEKGFIRLPAEMTKERKAKAVPLNHHARKALDALPRALHHDFTLCSPTRENQSLLN
jgi:integrase